MPKTFVIDTNVLLHDPDAIYAFAENEVVVSLAVVGELERKKNEPGLVGKHARQVASMLLAIAQSEQAQDGGLSRGVTIPNGAGGTLVIPGDLLGMPENVDEYLIDLAERLGAILITKDNYMRVKSHVRSVLNADYENDRVVENYTGHVEALASSDLIDCLYSGVRNHTFEEISLLEVFDSTKGLYPNQCLTIVSETDPKQTALCIIDKKVKNFSLIKTFNGIKACGIKPLNAEQRYALHLLLDPEITLVTINGSSGSGKTTLSLAAGIQGTIDGNYDNVIVTRKEVAVGGERQPWLPGDLKQKQDPWLKGIYNCLSTIAKTHQPNLDKAFSSGINRPYEYYLPECADIVHPESIAYARGATFDAFIILTEGQNLHPAELKTLVTRAGKRAKVVLEGDPKQIDCDPSTRYLDEFTNGLSVTVDKWRGYEAYGHITLSKNVRSELSMEAEKRYD